jgi:hypothetical protein
MILPSFTSSLSVAEVRWHATQSQHVILDDLTVIERGEVELPTQLLCRRLLHEVVTDSQGRDRVPNLLGHFLLGDYQHHLWWYHATQGIKHHYLLRLVGPTSPLSGLDVTC